MDNYATLLKPVWGLGSKKIEPLIKAAESGDRVQIEAATRSLEEMLANTPEDRFPCYEEYRGFEAEVKAKISVLKAIASGEQSNWEEAYADYQELKDAMDLLMDSCDPGEKISEIVFRFKAEHASELAALCLGQIKSEKAESAKELFTEEAKQLIDRIGPSLGRDYTYNPVFPKNCKSVCAVRRMTEDGSTYGFDTIYLVWKEPDGSIKHKEIKNSRLTKNYIDVNFIKVNKNGSVSVKFGSGNSYNGVPWSESMKVAISQEPV